MNQQMNFTSRCLTKLNIKSIFLFATIGLMSGSISAASADAAELLGAVIAVQGDVITVEVESAGTLQPAVGDILHIMERPNDEGNAVGLPGDWVITEVKGDIIRAKGKNLLKGLRPLVNMQAFINKSPRSDGTEKTPTADSEKKPFPTVKGKVIITRGKNVTIQLAEGQPAVSKGDSVELSYSVDDIVIPVGKWRISAINQNGTLEAEPVEAETEPTIGMDARVFTDASSKKVKVDSKKEPVRPDASNITVEEKSPLETACLNGNANACNDLGVKYATGEGVARNHSRAMELYRKACDIGSAVGCGNLAFFYRNGEGSPQDDAQAAAYFKRACNGGYASGCTDLGYMYEKGHGVSKDEKMAVDYYRKGCDGGNAIGCTNLGYMYENGYSVRKDHKLAADYYQKGCDGGNGRGCGNLGWMVYEGRGMSTDHRRGKELIQLACNMGHKWSCNKLKELGK